MTALALAEAENRVRLAQETLSAANIRQDGQSISWHTYRLMKAEEALTKARHADEVGDCRCALCRGVVSWDD